MRLFYTVMMFFFLYCCMASFALPVVRNLTTDQSSLLAFKANIADPRGVLMLNWSISHPVCSWVGVTCGARHHRVTALNLSSMALQATIPPHLGNLSFLLDLDVSWNDFNGSLPNELGQLRRLKFMNFAYNRFSGSFPSWIGFLSRLQILSLRSNNFTGLIPNSFSNLSKLEQLNASENMIDGNVQSGIGNLSTLRSLNLAYSNLQGEIPNEIGNLQNLEYLVLGGNNLSGPIPLTLFNFSSLLLFNLAINQLSGHLPSTLGQSLPKLKMLALGSNKFVGTIPNLITNASELILLELSSNSFSGLPNTFGNLRHLSFLNLARNHLTIESSLIGWSFLSSLTNCRNLTVLSLGDNPLQGILPPVIGNFSSSLQKFYAYNCKFQGNIPREIGNLSGLILLSIFNNDFNGTIPITMGKLQQLQGLVLNDNNLQGSIPYNLCHLKGLNVLLLYENKLSGHIPQCLANITSLRELNLGSNKFTSNIPSSLWALEYILYVNLSSNSLSGFLPSNIQNLKVLITLDLSRNQLAGEIPETIGGLKYIVNMSLASNEFQGPIPASLGSMTSLESLDLSNNNLSGEIPRSLETLSNLKQLNVSENRLEGEIPSQGPFKNFSAQSFLWNNALCGPSRFQVPSCKDDNNKRSKKSVLLVLTYVLTSIISIFLIAIVIIFFVKCGNRRAKNPDQGDLLSLATWRRTSYFEIQRATDEFNKCNLLGTGSFGSVYKGTLSDGTIVAIKVFNLQLERAFRSFNSECEVLRNIRHRNLLKILSSCCSEDFKALVLEYMPNGSLEKWLYSHNYFLDILQRLNIMVDVGFALEYLHHGHSKLVIHCDLKPNNILLDETMVGHVSDFGISKLLGEEDDFVTHTMTMATIGYMAPEYGSEGIVSSRCDVYSYGILLMETFARMKPTDEMFTGEMNLKDWVKKSLPHGLIQVIDANLLREEQGFSAKMDCLLSIMQLALDCCMESPDERIHMTDAAAKVKKIKEKFQNDVAATN